MADTYDSKSYEVAPRVGSTPTSGTIPQWNPKLAYIVGLITTDGSLSKDGRHIDFTSADLQLLKTFRKCLSLKNRITRKYGGHNPKRKCHHLQFSNVELYNWLTSIGLMPNKTYRLGEIAVPREYFRDFLRGHLDGDGSVFTYIDRYMVYKDKRYTYHRLYTVFNSASSNHLKWMQSTLEEILNIKGSLKSWVQKNRKTPVWKLKFSKKESLKLLSWLYYKPGLPCLNRKKKIAKRVIKIFQKPMTVRS